MIRQALGGVVLWIAVAATLAADSPPLTDITALAPTECCDGSKFQFDAKAEYYVLVFLGVECPVARQYGGKLQAIADLFKSQPVQFIGINSNLQDTQAEVAAFQRELKINFPMLKDSSQLLAKKFAATRTAEVVLVDAKGSVQYQGRIDDQYSPGVAKGKITSNDLIDAIQAKLRGEAVAQPRTNPVGCVITFKKSPIEQPTVTFTKEIAPLLWQHCYECHRSGEIGPFDISDYEDLQGWGEMLIEVMQQKRMPPWHASPEHGQFKNARRLPEGMVATVQKWIDEGMPYGNPADLPAKPEFPSGWSLPKEPDLVIEMRERPYRVPSTGTVDYQYFVVDPGLTEDRWVYASQIVPGAPSVVHHAIAFVRPPDNGEFIGIGWLNAYVPGQRPVIYPEGYARKIPAGSKLVFQMHYTPSGIEALDRTKIGLCFLDPAQVTHQIYTTVAIEQDFEIPPGVAAHSVDAQMMPAQDNAMLLAISPHMHLRGKAFDVFAKRGDQTEFLLRVPSYDFNWQHTYELAQPLPVKEFDSVNITATFDNSKENPFNPNPADYVMWGDQTWEEMALGYFDVAIPYQPANSVELHSRPVARPGSRNRTFTASEESVKKFVEDSLLDLDVNRDGIITRREATQVFRDYGFWTIDENRDGKITREELEKTARGRSGI
jgi:AhpC/TSA family/Copper type II ascorbate-dependent monooxygenase, C-terminal domain/EF hand